MYIKMIAINDAWGHSKKIERSFVTFLFLGETQGDDRHHMGPLPYHWIGEHEKQATIHTRSVIDGERERMIGAKKQTAFVEKKDELRGNAAK